METHNELLMLAEASIITDESEPFCSASELLD